MASTRKGEMRGSPWPFISPLQYLKKRQHKYGLLVMHYQRSRNYGKLVREGRGKPSKFNLRTRPPHARRPRARNDFLFESIFARRRAPRRRKLRGISNEPHRYFTPEYFYFAMKDSEFCIGHPPTTRPHMKRGKIKK